MKVEDDKWFKDLRDLIEIQDSLATTELSHLYTRGFWKGGPLRVEFMMALCGIGCKIMLGSNGKFLPDAKDSGGNLIDPSTLSTSHPLHPPKSSNKKTSWHLRPWLLN